MSHVNDNEHVQIKSQPVFCKNCCEMICKPHLWHIQQEVKTSEAQEKTREWSNLNSFQNCLNWTCIINTNKHLYFWVHIRFTPSEGPKAFKIVFLRSRIIEKGHLPWSDFMVHSVKLALKCPQKGHIPHIYIGWNLKLCKPMKMYVYWNLDNTTGHLYSISLYLWHPNPTCN